MTVAEFVVLVLAGGAAGAVNAVAGGGSLISFPALLALGLPAVDANVTNAVAVVPGYAGTAYAYRRELSGQTRRVAVLAVSALVGAVVGSVLLLTAPDAVFDTVVPALIVASCALLAVQDRVAAWVRSRSAASGGEGTLGLHAGVFAGGVYGAYFGGGLGVLLLAVLGIFIADHLQRLNGLKTVLSLIINALALVLFALFGPVDWAFAAVLAPACLTGGFLGGRLARRLSPTALRSVVVAFGLCVAFVLLMT